MHSSHPIYEIPRKSPIFIIISALILISLAWSVEGCKKTTPTPIVIPTTVPATPTKVPENLPPALVETDPLPGSQIALKNPITLYFNQPMQPTSVEAAVTGEPTLSGSFAWSDDATLTFTPDTPLLPDTPLTINIAATAQSAKGMALLQPISLSYTTSGYLKRCAEPACEWLKRCGSHFSGCGVFQPAGCRAGSRPCQSARGVYNYPHRKWSW